MAVAGMAAALMLAAFAPAAQAATPVVSINAGVFDYTATTGNNDVTLKVVGSDLVLTDAEPADVALGAGTATCTDIAKSGAQDPGARCPLADVPNGATIDVGPVADIVTVDANVTLPVEIQGGPGNGTYTGGSGNDRIFGGTGKDTLTGGAGDDFLSGDDNKDTLAGGLGNDTLQGGEDDDQLVEQTGQGIDWGDYADHTVGVTAKIGAISGQPGEDDALSANIENLRGGSGADTLTGNSGTGGVLAGSNVIDGGLGGDTIKGDRGFDTIDYASRTCALTVTVGSGSNDDGCAAEGDTIDASIESVLGGTGNDTLVGSAPATFPNPQNPAEPFTDFGAGLLSGGDGNDILGATCDEQPSSPDIGDVFTGGAGVDTVTYGAAAGCVGRTSAVRATIDGVNDDGAPGEGDSIMPDIENVTGGAGDDTIAGDSATNVLIGGIGNDVVDGHDGGDIVAGDQGNDSLGGGAGGDVLAGGGGTNGLDGGPGGDALLGGPDSDNLDGGPGADGVSGGLGQDTATYATRVGAISVNLDGQPNDGEGGEGDNLNASDIETVIGGSSDDGFSGSTGSNRFDGGSGDDSFDGGPGGDTFVGGPGRDTANYAARSTGVGVTIDAAPNDGEPGEGDNINADVVLGGAGADSLGGSDAGETLTGAAGDDSIAGGGGADQLAGGSGNDTVAGGDGNDNTSGDGGDDALDGGSGTDQLQGGDGDDTLTPGAGAADVVSGGTGSDLASYAERTNGVNLSIDGQANDGEAGESDGVSSDVERLASGAGNDTLDSRDAQQSAVNCGAGKDMASVDTIDTAQSDCEVVKTVTVAALARPDVSTRKARATKSGRIAIKLSCPPSGNECNGELTLRAASSKGKPRLKGVLARETFAIPAGTKETVRLRLGSKARKALTKRHKLKIKAVALPDGAATGSSTSVPIEIKAPKRKKGNR